MIQAFGLPASFDTCSRIHAFGLQYKLRGDEPRTTPWAGMIQAFGLAAWEAFGLAASLHTYSGIQAFGPPASFDS
jgi:hypothetical protein